MTEVVAKGGNLALNVGPQPDGRLPRGAVRCMKELGDWLKSYGEAIYGTRPCAPYFKSNCAFTSKDDLIYCIYLYPKEPSTVPDSVVIPYAGPVSAVDLVSGQEGLEFERTDGGLRVALPESDLAASDLVAHVFRLRKAI